MLAIIAENNGEYVSPVFALQEAQGKSEVLVFDCTRTKLKRVKMYGRSSGHSFVRQVFLVAWEEWDFGRKNWRGPAWVFEDKDLWRELLKHGEAAVERHPNFLPYAGKVALPDWFTVESEKDITSLLEAAYSFHDGTVERIEEQENYTEIEFDTHWECTITVRFWGVKEMRYFDCIGIIGECAVTRDEDGFWFEAELIQTGRLGGVIEDMPLPENPYILAEGISWSIKIDLPKT